MSVIRVFVSSARLNSVCHSNEVFRLEVVPVPIPAYGSLNPFAPPLGALGAPGVQSAAESPGWGWSRGRPRGRPRGRQKRFAVGILHKNRRPERREKKPGVGQTKVSTPRCLRGLRQRARRAHALRFCMQSSPSLFLPSWRSSAHGMPLTTSMTLPRTCSAKHGSTTPPTSISKGLCVGKGARRAAPRRQHCGTAAWTHAGHAV